MKKVITFALLAVALTAALPAKAQLQFGLKGGLNVTSMSFSEDVFDKSNQAGFFIGPTVKFTLPIVGLGADASVLYDQRSAKMKAYTGNASGIVAEETLKQQQVVIPINLRYAFGLGEAANVFFFAGPQFGFNVGDKEKPLWDGVAEWTLKSSNFSVNVGLGAMLLNHLQISANYNIACGKTGEVSSSEILKAVKDKAHANAWQIALAYYF